MNLTFKGFLRGYCRELTGLETDCLKKLLDCVTGDSPAAAEAVMVFAAIQNKADYLVRLSEGSWVNEGYAAFSAFLTAFDTLEHALESVEAPQRYQKVWRAYCAKRDAITADRRVIGLMRTKTLDALQERGITVYALCSRLGLNKGNAYAYLNGGDVTKVSRATARRMLDAALQ